MSTRKPSAAQQLAHHNAGARTAFRVGGLILLGLALTLVVIGFVDFVGMMNQGFSDDPFASGEAPEPTNFWMLLVGLPLLGLAGWSLQAGFVGVAARYVSEETHDAVRTTSSAVGEGLGSRDADQS